MIWQATISEALTAATQRHQSGDLEAAERIYRQILQADPNQPEAIHRLGAIAHQVGKHEMALEYMTRSIQLRENAADFHYNLAQVYDALHRNAEAIACCRRAAELNPGLAEGHISLGVALTNLGSPDEAIACFHRALKASPTSIQAYNNLGNAFLKKGRPNEAIASYRRALELNPNFVEALNNLGNALLQTQSLDEAITCFHRALELNPGFTAALNNLGNAYTEQGKLIEAIDCFRRALALKPELAEAHFNLGKILRSQGNWEEAIASFHRALEINPDSAGTHNDLGLAYEDQGKPDKALTCFRRALELEPDFPEALSNLGVSFVNGGRPDEAVDCLRRAVALKPSFADAHTNLGNACKDQGKVDEAIACYRRALALDPSLAGAHSNLVYTQIFQAGSRARTLYDEYRRWDRQHAAPLASFIRPPLNDRSPDRRLRVGYVSPDFRGHVIGRNLLPLFREHDHREFEIICYADAPQPDEITRRFREYADGWRETAGLTDSRLAEGIWEDRVDILVDLTLHMAGNRLLVFARRPAPVQVTFAGYPGTTGLSTIDYRLTDPYLDPPGLDDPYYSEESIRLPDSFWCYDPTDREPPVNALPALKNGHITFGCLNNFCKVNRPVLQLWARILKTVGQSRLIILAGEGSQRRETLDLLEHEEVSTDRITFVSKQPRPEYLGRYHEIDIGLDTFPYNGHTTSLDSAWMGVPVVTLAGETVVGRAGVSQLTNLGLPELIASTAEQYVRIAAGLAKDLTRLSRLRATLRSSMEKSPLMGAPRFARGIEGAYRKMWQRWCGT